MSSITSRELQLLRNKKKVKEFVDNLKKGKKYSKDDLFSNLRHAHHHQAEDDEFIVIKLNTKKEFNRVAAVYNKNMHSAFILPVWAAAYLTKEDQDKKDEKDDKKDKDKTEYEENKDRGFVLYPRLHSVKSLLDDDESFKRLEEEKVRLEGRLEEVKREEAKLKEDKPEEVRLEDDDLEDVGLEERRLEEARMWKESLERIRLEKSELEESLEEVRLEKARLGDKLVAVRQEEVRQDVTLEKARQAVRRNILRYTFAPVALAIDTLHTPVANRRPMFYHGAISVDTVFLKTGEHHHVSRRRYRNAKLKLTETSTECFESYDDCNVTGSLGRDLEYKYFHHPDPWDKTKPDVYLTQHDWFSFGVFIVEVLTKLAGLKFIKHEPSDEKEPDRVVYYVEAANKLKSISPTELEKRFGKNCKEGYKHYADIALQCLENKEAFDFTLDHLTHQFEYGVGLQTARLLEFHYGSKPKEYYDYDDPKARTLSECQACLLRKPVRIPTRSYRSGKESRRCLKDCDRFYCAQCHTNGERLFCPEHEHGPTRTSIGGDAYFALILYGEEYKGENKDVFKSDAENIRNVLMHSMICGIPNSNIVLSALFDKADQVNSLELLRKACKDLMGEIMKKNDKFNFHLFVFYSGHGTKTDMGAWCPTDSDTLSPADINDTLYLLRGREVIARNQSTIPARLCGQVTYILNHCYPPNADIEWLSIAQEVTHKLTLSPPKLGKAYLQNDGNSSVITDWLCNFFRSLIHKGCNGGCPECPLKHVNEHIAGKCHGSYLDAECLTKFMMHCPSSDEHGRPTAEPTLIDRVIEGQKIIMAPYHADGVHMKVFAFEKSEAVSSSFNIDFKETLDFKDLSKYVMERLSEIAQANRTYQHQPTGANGYPRLCFLTNAVGTACSTEYDLVWESDVPHILALGSLNLKGDYLSPSVLYYRVVEEPLEVTLECGETQDPSTYKLNLKLDEETDKLETACVPSLLVGMVHHLFLMYQNTARRLERQDAGKEVITSDNDVAKRPAANDDGEEAVDVDRYESDNHVVDRLKRIENPLKTSEEVRNSFADFLYYPRKEEKVNLKTFRPDDWKQLAVEAGKYKKIRGIFNISEIEPGMSICIKWQELPQTTFQGMD